MLSSLRVAILLLAAMLCFQVKAAPSESLLSLPPETKLSAADAKAKGLEQKTFDFKADDINFSSYLPAGATVKTVPEKRFDPAEQFGHLFVIGKANWPDSPFEVSIMEYQVRSPVSALRVCQYEAENSGYNLKQYEVGNDLAVASVYAAATSKFFYGKCYVRGTKVLGVYVLTAPKQMQNTREQQEALEKARALASVLFGNLEFGNGKPNGFGPHVQNIPLKIGEAPYSVTIPGVWDVKFNDFHGSLPAELSLIREEGRKGALWFGVREEKAPLDLDRTGKENLPQIIESWAPGGLGFIKLVETSDDPELKGFDIMSKSFRYLVTGSKGEDMGDVLAVLAQLNGRVYGLILWSPLPLKTDSEYTTASLAFNRMPGLTVYDAFKMEIIRMARFKPPPK